jgi:hypothetical protein
MRAQPVDGCAVFATRAVCGESWLPGRSFAPQILPVWARIASDHVGCVGLTSGLAPARRRSMGRSEGGGVTGLSASRVSDTDLRLHDSCYTICVTEIRYTNRVTAVQAGR